MLKFGGLVSAGLLAIAAMPTTANATVVINSVGSNPGFLNGSISLAGHFTNLNVGVGRFSLSGTQEPGGTPVNFLTYCVDLLHYIGNGSFEIEPLSLLVSNATKRNQLTTLITKTSALITGFTQNDKDISAATQLAVWEIISETSSSSYSLSNGLFTATGTNAATLNLAQTYLTGVTTGGWTPVAGQELKILYSPRNQSQVYITAVPEPATWAMMILGFGLIGMGIRRARSPEQTLRLLRQAA